MQTQPVVAVTPSGADRVRFFQNGVAHSALSQHRGNGEPGWPSSHDDGLGGHPCTLPVESALAAVCGLGSMGSNDAFTAKSSPAGSYRTSECSGGSADESTEQTNSE